MFEEMLGDMRGMIRVISLAVVFSLLCVAANSMAMSMRERTSEVAVLKAIGFNQAVADSPSHGADRGRAGRRMPAGAIGVLGSKRTSAGRRRLHGWAFRRLPAFLLHSLEHRAPGCRRLAGYWSGQWFVSGHTGRESFGYRWLAEGRLSRHDPAQIQRPQPSRSLEDDRDDHPGHGADRLVVVHPLRPGRGPRAQPEGFGRPARPDRDAQGLRDRDHGRLRGVEGGRSAGPSGNRQG